MAGNEKGDIRVGDAWRALRALLQDPDDTAQVFRIIDALSGKNGERTLARLRRSRSGKELLEKRPDVLARLTDRAALLALPPGTLGREYVRFLDSEGITAEGLLQASIEGHGENNPEAGSDLRFLRDRLRDTHDLWHTVTGYKGDIIGEASLLAFSFAQTWNPGVGLVVLAAIVQGGEAEIRKLIAGGFARGLKAAWLPSIEWEKLLDRPLDEVRRSLNVGAPVAYEPLRTVNFKAPQAA
jgi:ubiquinone biosynthesis protein COQ4